MDSRPIAVFDSGLGGLTVWKEIRALMPRESLLYYGDGKNCPYGSKPVEDVIGYVDAAARLLIDQHSAKMLVVACNAATAAAIDFLREKYGVPIVGMEPAVKPAALTTRSGVIGILATANTLKGRLFRETAAKYAQQVKILQAVGEDFVELVEAGMERTPQAVEAARRALCPMLEQGADRIVLGCTHYPLLAAAMREVIGGRDVELIDPAPAVARRAYELLRQEDLLTGVDNVPSYEFFTAAGEDYRHRIMRMAEEIMRGVQG